jgi:hypothetical protein
VQCVLYLHRGASRVAEVDVLKLNMTLYFGNNLAFLAFEIDIWNGIEKSDDLGSSNV